MSEGPPVEPTVVEWGEHVVELRRRTTVPGARANAGLLEQAGPNWVGRVTPRTSMHDLLFTKVGDDHPFRESLRVAWDEGVFVFTLLSGQALVATDRCFDANAPAVLDAFLAQLVGGQTTFGVAPDAEVPSREEWQRGDA